MAIEPELDQLCGRTPGGSVVEVGTYVNMRNLCYFNATASATLPALDWWHCVATTTAGNATTASNSLNNLLNSGTATLAGPQGAGAGTSPVTGSAYNYTLVTYTSSMLPNSKGQGSMEG
jgi:hypothetical protein